LLGGQSEQCHEMVRKQGPARVSDSKLAGLAKLIEKRQHDGLRCLKRHGLIVFSVTSPLLPAVGTFCVLHKSASG
jgi:hypothetical protein